MFVKVRLLNTFSKELTYAVDDTLQAKPGMLVQVPLQRRSEPAVITKIIQQQHFPFKVRDVEKVYDFPRDATYYTFIQKLAWYYQTEPIYCIKRLKAYLQQKPASKPHIQEKPEKKSFFTLTKAQQKAFDSIAPLISQQAFHVFCLHGVTGSGKTEVYKHALLHAYKQNKTSFFIVPEVPLAMQFEKRLQHALPDIPIFGFHSASSALQKKQLWDAVVKGEPCIIVGVHLPPLLPVENLGLIVIDEEHETGYQEKKHPRINTKEALLLRASMASVPVILGSATPSLQTLYNIKQKGWTYLQLTDRFAGAMPKCDVVLLPKEKKRPSFWISKKLQHEITGCLDRKEQAIIFLNRRGYSFFIQCKECGYRPCCSACSVSLTLHGVEKLLCHYCGYIEKYPKICSECQASGSSFLKKGVGTQQVVEILQKLFPFAHIARADLDTTSKQKQWNATVQAFMQRDIDILVGTQSITKGYHFPHVTLVGVLWADLSLHMPFYNASEVTLQQLLQVAGRAGRQKHESKVIVQTMTEHPIFGYMQEERYIDFAKQLLEDRELMLYPPVAGFAEIEIIADNEALVAQEAQAIADVLIKVANAYDVHVLGPAQALVYKVKTRYTQKIYLKGKTKQAIVQVFSKLNKSSYTSSIYFTPNPVA